MHDPKKAADPSAVPVRPTAPPPRVDDGPTQRQTGGFGAFSEVYRARWAKNHPHMRRREPADPTGLPADAPPLPQPASTENQAVEKRSESSNSGELS